ncbi:AI-2E family transporter [Actinocorallia sp. API 0066]|uniref:AI-2E family transporter n=1 Tax=Actinocorallia sp. API 0066 TaxID=2896846 RepID=UPI001E6460DF|nr:AI-2E family transporter [Actinocorallia sp. API 0066]MCD0447954.1 AI-2E family transporter [Actinocorallia sp. API 0066]
MDRARPLAPGLLVLLGLAASAIVLTFLQNASGWVGPAVLALLLTIAVQPLRAWLSRLGAPDWVLFVVPLLVVLVFLVFMGVAISLAITQLISLLPAHSQQFVDLLNRGVAWLGHLGVDTSDLWSRLSKLDPANLVPYLQTALNGLLSVGSAGVLLVTLLVAMSLDANALGRELTALEPAKPELVRALRGAVRDTYSYLKVSTIFGALMALLDVGVLYLLGVPLPWLWGLLAFIANYIPTLGFLLALIPPALLTLLISGPAKALAVVAAYIVINFITQSLLLPKFLSTAVGLSVTLTMLSLIVWTSVLGPLGALLAVPLTLMVRALLLDPDPTKRWAVRLLTGPTPHP